MTTPALPPPARIALEDGAWLAYRPLPGTRDRAVVTHPAGRFILLGETDLVALTGHGPRVPAVHRLATLGFVRPPSSIPQAPTKTETETERHVLQVIAPMDPDGGCAVMSEGTASTLVDRMFHGPARALHIEFRGGDPMANAPAVYRVVEHARTRARAEGRAVSFSLVTHLGATTEAVCDGLIDAGIAVTALFDGPPAVHEARRPLTGAPPYEVAAEALQTLHARYAARGIAPDLAYVTVAVTVTPATCALGPGATLDALGRLGAVFVQLQPHPRECPPETFLGFYREALGQLLATNLAGTLRVEKRLALYLEALVAGTRPGHSPQARTASFTYGPDGAVTQRPRASRSSPDGCASCAYDPYCRTDLVQGATLDPANGPANGPADRSWGTPWCQTSMGTLDAVFTRLDAPGAGDLQRVFRQWMAVRDRVAARLRAP